MYLEWLPMEAAILKLSLKFKIMKLNLFLKKMHTHILLTVTMFAYYVNNQYHCELATSQPHWFSGSQVDISKFSIVNNFRLYSPICMKFAPNSLVLAILSSCLRFKCFRSLSIKSLGKLSDCFDSLVRVKQQPLSPLLFILFLNDLTHELDIEGDSDAILDEGHLCLRRVFSLITKIWSESFDFALSLLLTHVVCMNLHYHV